ncbi:MAG: hypothetical protein JWM34_3909 [Ilumatobacteraceae bacterium]|nr:hypothetical protein [Ilumatobacteraceae bacterium]
MHRHHIDLVSAVFGAAAIVVGVLVIIGRADTLVDNPVSSIAIVAIAIGMTLVDYAFRRLRKRRAV